MRGLVLEGGGMRSVFTAGVLDAFQDCGVKFDYVIGTSAGSTCGINYLAGQHGRSRYINIDLHTVRPYVGIGPFIEGHGVIDMDFLFETVPAEMYPFDFETFFAKMTSGVRFIAVATEAETGQATYLEEKRDAKRLVDICRASCSLPIMCPMWSVDGHQMVDGGVSDSIPYDRALSDGCEQVVVVLTKDASYRKSERFTWLPRRVYKEYPMLREALIARNQAYNAQLDRLAELERKGKVRVIRPDGMCGVGRTTSDTSRLEALYAKGVQAGLKWSKRL